MVGRYTALTAVVLVSLIFAACGFNESPEWAGHWKVTSPDDIESMVTYYDLSEETTASIHKNLESEDCTIFSHEVLEVDGNVITTTPARGGKSKSRVRYEVSDETLKVTFPDSTDQREIIAEPVGTDPRDLAGCEQ